MSSETPPNAWTERADRTSYGAQEGWVRRALLVTLFAVAFGYVESAVVVYLRVIYDPVRASLYPQKPPESLLPLMTVEQLRAVDPLHVRRLVIEVGRELATMVLLATVACLAARRRGEFLAIFMIAFGVWDATYYVGLKALIDFPISLTTWDILFLIPVPWLGPVLAPLIVSLSMIIAGLVILTETGRGRAFRPAWFHWAGVVLGGLIIIASFCKDYVRTTSGELPEPFDWFIFATG